MRASKYESEAEIDDSIFKAYVVGGLHEKDKHNKKFKWEQHVVQRN